MKDLARRLHWEVIVILIAVALGAGVRFWGIGWGLENPPHADEQVYVGNTNAMLDAGDLNHRYYYYPGLFFYFLAPILDLLGESRRHGPEAYLAGRVAIASIGSFNVWLMARVGRAIAGPWAAVGAAFALAVFPLSARVAHEVRPDIPLETAGILALALYASEKWDRREWGFSGILVGLATAIKFSGFLLWSGVGAAALLRRASLTRLLATTGLSLLIVLAATPILVRHPEFYFGGGSELHVYFRGFALSDLWRNVKVYGSAAFSFGGVLGAAIAAVGFAALTPATRVRMLPWLAHFLVTFGIFSLASMAFPRHILQVTSGLCLLFGVGIARAARSSRLGAAILMALALTPPLQVSVRTARALAAPSAPDRAREWIASHMKDGAVILETRRDASQFARPGAAIGVDKSRFEFVEPVDSDRAALRALMPHADLVIADAERSLKGSLFAGFQPAYVVQGTQGDPDLALLVPLLRGVMDRLEPGEVRASTGEGMAALTDDRFTTLWSSKAPMNGTEWIELRFAAEHPICRVEIDMPLPSPDDEPELAIRLGDGDGSNGRRVRSASLRPSREDQVRFGRPSGETLVFEPVSAKIVRLEQLGVRKTPWVLRNVRVFECVSRPS